MEILLQAGAHTIGINNPQVILPLIK